MTTSAAAAATTKGQVKVGNPNNPKATATVTETTTIANTGSSVSMDTDTASSSTSSPGNTAGAPINPLPVADLTGPVSEILLTGPVSGGLPVPVNGLNGPVSGDLTGPVSGGLPVPVNGLNGPVSGDLTGPVSEILLTGPAGGDLSGPATSKLADAFIEPSVAITSGSSLSTIRNQQPVVGTVDDVEEGVLEANAAAEAAASAKNNKNHTIFSKLDTNGLISLALISLACVSLLSVVWCTIRTVTQLRSNSRSKSMNQYGESSGEYTSSEQPHHHRATDGSKPFPYLAYNQNKTSNSNLMNQSSTSNSLRERSEESELIQSPYGACERDALLWQDSNI